jgi:hypothetical protein
MTSRHLQPEGELPRRRTLVQVCLEPSTKGIDRDQSNGTIRQQRRLLEELKNFASNLVHQVSDWCSGVAIIFRVLFPPVPSPVQSSLFTQTRGPPSRVESRSRGSTGVGRCAKLTRFSPRKASITHLEDAVGAQAVKLIQEEVAYLEDPYVPHRIVGHQ